MKINPSLFAERAVDDDDFVQIGRNENILDLPSAPLAGVIVANNLQAEEQMEQELLEVQFLLKSRDPSENIILKFFTNENYSVPDKIEIIQELPTASRPGSTRRITMMYDPIMEERRIWSNIDCEFCIASGHYPSTGVCTIPCPRRGTINVYGGMFHVDDEKFDENKFSEFIFRKARQYPKRIMDVFRSMDNKLSL